MSQLIEFASNHLLLFGAFVVVTVLLVKAELENRFSKVNQLNAVEAVRLMNNDETIILDVREASEFGGGHIKNAIHIPMSALKGRITELEKYKGKHILAYCRSGSRSGYACKLLNKAGFEQVHNLAGGVMGWSSANLPLTRK